jgi:hypothetical protein
MTALWICTREVVSPVGIFGLKTLNGIKRQYSAMVPQNKNAF